ncbi:MAG: hypothetical protein JWO36_1444 [Myxococcales bacterium]|nr:hypothetical protein [Myxococcales bacterium]
MRKYLVLALACSSGLAAAKPKASTTPKPKPVTLNPNDKPKPIDIKDKLSKLDVYKDELGNFYVSPNPSFGLDMEDANTLVFFGDAKALYQQRVIGSSLQDGNHWTWNVWAPRAKGASTATIELVPDQSSLMCRVKDGKRMLTHLKADEAKAFFEHATFYPVLWQRQAKFLARDDDGVYYYVDELREEYGGNGFHIYAGMKGSMKELPMTNVVSDSAGDLYATKTGQLKIIAGSDGTAVWVKGGKKIELTVLNPLDNRYLIYRDLGIYGQLGAVCDDL